MLNETCGYSLFILWKIENKEQQLGHMEGTLCCLRFTKQNELDYFGGKEQDLPCWSCSSLFFSFVLSEASSMHRLQDKSTNWDHQASSGAQAMGFP